ncbi:MAG TPA: hypothetical protein PKM72_13880 [Nitrospirales bacterium]|nr:hypothetical protein [Nitrospira sp. MA-1]HNP61931.1 hypothetical protein [Nitrospirales bacterium]
MASFNTVLSTHFPKAIPQEDFVKRSYDLLQAEGFRAENTIAFVSLCRDELTLPFVEDVKKTWGEAFIFSSLGGMLFLGKTGFLAAQHHAPNEDGRERYVYFALPHIGVDTQGEIGRHDRPGRLQPSHACGALHGFQAELANRCVSLGIDLDDIEQSLLKQHLFRKLTYGDIPDLLSLTKTAYAVILEELERMIQLTVDPVQNDYAVLTGIQIHGPQGMEYIWPGETYWVRDGNRHTIVLE